MVKVSVPNFFKCPISLKLMQDPVTLCTGQTYDRRSIENWFAVGHNTCPSSMQVLSSLDVAPNSLLRGLIQSWLVSNPNFTAFKEEEAASPTAATKYPDVRDVVQMLRVISVSGNDSTKLLQALRMMVKVSPDNRNALLEAGGVETVSKFLFTPANVSRNIEACEEALALLILLPLNCVRQEIALRHKQLSVISWLLCRGSLNARVDAASFLARLASINPDHDHENVEEEQVMKVAIGTSPGVFEGLVELLNEDRCARAPKAALKAFLSLLELEGNASKCVEAGLTFALVEFIKAAEGRNLERALTLLEMVCSSFEGQAAVSSHALAIPVLARIIRLNGSNRVTEKSISCLWELCNQRGASGQSCVDDALAEGVLPQLLRYMSSVNGSRQRATYLKVLLSYRWKACCRI